MDAASYNGEYLINKDGTILSLKPKYYGRLMKFREDSDGYIIVNLCLNGVKITEKVHRLVAQKYIPNPDNLPEVNHIDGDKTNNNDWNLEWCDNSYNKIHAYKTGLRRSRKGEYNKPTKKVLQINSDGKLVKEFGSYAEAERFTGIGNAFISVRANTNKTAGGYYWKTEKITTCTQLN